MRGAYPVDGDARLHSGSGTTTEEVADVLEAFGFDRILIETVEWGQTELDVRRHRRDDGVGARNRVGHGIQRCRRSHETAELYVVTRAIVLALIKLKQESGSDAGDSKGQCGKEDLPTVQRFPTAWESPVILTVASKGRGQSPSDDRSRPAHEFPRGTGKLVEAASVRLPARTRAWLNRAIRQCGNRDGDTGGTLPRARLDDVAPGHRSRRRSLRRVLEQVEEAEARWKRDYQ